jgi:hypothetical protein
MHADDADDRDPVALVALCRKLGIAFEREDPYPAIAAELTRRGQKWGHADADTHEARYGSIYSSAGGPRDPSERITEAERRRMLIASAEREGYVVKVKRNVDTRWMKARKTAIEKLIANHSEEYDTLHRKERVELGLPEDPTPAKKLSRIELLREQLRAAGIEPKI